MELIHQIIGTFIAAGFGLIGVFVGARLTQKGNLRLEQQREERECTGLSSALLAEVQAIIHVEEAHSYRALYQDTLNRIKKGEATLMPNISYETNPARSVYYTNLSRIGTLPVPIPEKMVRLAYEFEVIAADRKCMDKGEWNTQEQSQRITMLEHHLKTYDAFVALAHEVAECLEKARNV